MASLRFAMSVLTLYLSSLLDTTYHFIFYNRANKLSQKHAALFIFGDSFFDAGNNGYLNGTSLKANYPPYGETFFNSPTGRFSDGRIIPDFIAEYAKLPLIPVYLDPRFNDDEYIYGVNFASAGAGALVETNQGMVINLKTQASQFREVSKQLRQKLQRDAKAEKLLSSAVYIFSVGGNDYSNIPSINTNSSNAQEVASFVIGNISNTIQEIYNEGGRNFGFVNLPPLSCFPIQRRLQNGTTMDACLKGEISTLAKLHNNAFLEMLQKLEKQLEGFRYSVFYFYSAFTELMKYPSKYGFKNASAACCGGGQYRGDGSCGRKGRIEEYELCDDVNDYIFFDSVHPTEKANQHFANLMWSGNRDATEPYNLKQLFGL